MQPTNNESSRTRGCENVGQIGAVIEQWKPHSGLPGAAGRQTHTDSDLINREKV